MIESSIITERERKPPMVQLLDNFDESEDETWGKSVAHIEITECCDQAEG